MRHIMVATDGSSGADRAVDVAAEVARALSGDLLIVSVADSLAFEEAQQLARTEGSTGDVLEALTTQMLKAAEARARHLGVSQIELRVGWAGAAAANWPACCLAVSPRSLSASHPALSPLCPECKVHVPAAKLSVLRTDPTP